MNVDPLTMSADEAREAFLQYRRSVRERHTQEDKAVMAGYRAISRGQRVIDLDQAMKAAGVDVEVRPRLAICRADAKWCFYRSSGGTAPKDAIGVFRSDNTYFGRGPKSVEVRLQRGMLIPRLRRGDKWLYHSDPIKALVPLIPAPLRPAAKLSNYHILWEAEWENVPIDPYLLKHLGGSLYAVLAEWDLTPIERAVLAGRMTR